MQECSSLFLILASPFLLVVEFGGEGCLILGAVACNHPQHNPFPLSNYSLASKTWLGNGHDDNTKNMANIFSHFVLLPGDFSTLHCP